MYLVLEAAYPTDDGVAYICTRPKMLFDPESLVGKSVRIDRESVTIRKVLRFTDRCVVVMLEEDQ